MSLWKLNMKKKIWEELNNVNIPICLNHSCKSLLGHKNHKCYIRMNECFICIAYIHDHSSKDYITLYKKTKHKKRRTYNTCNSGENVVF